jgi:hypothetical protein
MTCPRCDGLVVREYLLDSREGSLSGFHGLRCVNCGAIHDDVIRRNQRWPPSLKGVEDLKRAMVNLRLVSTQGAGCQQENGGDEGRVPYRHTARIDMRFDL